MFAVTRYQSPIPHSQPKSKKEAPLMADKEPRALIPLPSGGLANIGSGPKSILSGMVSDVLALARAREKSLAVAHFRIGEYEFRDPDYRQILIWAKALELEPEVFIGRLEKSHFNQAIAFEVKDGSIVSLRWDFDIFPITSFEWVDGLKIKTIVFNGCAKSKKISLRLPLLSFLGCSACGLTELDLSAVPALTRLSCSYNKIVKLDLSAVPALTQLSCDHNKLVELDLSAVPALTVLWCHSNQLVQLDISMVPMLTILWCNENKLVELDIRELGQLKNFNRDPFVTLKNSPPRISKNE